MMLSDVEKGNNLMLTWLTPVATLDVTLFLGNSKSCPKSLWPTVYFELTFQKWIFLSTENYYAVLLYLEIGKQLTKMCVFQLQHSVVLAPWPSLVSKLKAVSTAVVLKLWYAKTLLKVVREEAYFLFFFTKNIFTAVVFTCRVLLINS